MSQWCFFRQLMVFVVASFGVAAAADSASGDDYDFERVVPCCLCTDPLAPATGDADAAAARVVMGVMVSADPEGIPECQNFAAVQGLACTVRSLRRGDCR